MTIAEALGQAIAEARIAKDMSQRQLAAAMGLEETGRCYLSRAEQGASIPKVEAVLRIATALGIKAHDIIRRAEELQPESSSKRVHGKKPQRSIGVRPPSSALPKSTLVKHPVAMARRRELGRKLGMLA